MGIMVAPTAAAYAAMQHGASTAAAAGEDHGRMRALAVETFPRLDPEQVGADDVRRAQQLRARLASVRNWNERKIATRSLVGASNEWLQQVQLLIEDKRLDEAEAAIRARERALGLARGRP